MRLHYVVIFNVVACLFLFCLTSNGNLKKNRKFFLRISFYCPKPWACCIKSLRIKYSNNFVTHSTHFARGLPTPTYICILYSVASQEYSDIFKNSSIIMVTGNPAVKRINHVKMTQLYFKFGPFHKTLPKSSLQIHWISERFLKKPICTHAILY